MIIMIIKSEALCVRTISHQQPRGSPDTKRTHEIPESSRFGDLFLAEFEICLYFIKCLVLLVY